MAALAEGLDALEVRGRTVSEVSSISDADGLLEAVQLIFADGQCLTSTVWTDWRLVVELTSEVVMPDYLWPVEEKVRTAMEGLSGSGKVVGRVDPRFNEVDMLMDVRFELDDRWLLLRSFGGELVLESG